MEEKKKTEKSDSILQQNLSDTVFNIYYCKNNAINDIRVFIDRHMK